jgi:hypothetical protein
MSLRKIIEGIKDSKSVDAENSKDAAGWGNALLLMVIN